MASPAGLPVGGPVLATRSVAADLGAESPDGFIPVDELGMPPELLGGGTAIDGRPGAAGARCAPRCPAAVVGAVLTVSTVTGTAASTAALRRPAPGRGGRGHGGVRGGGRRRAGRHSPSPSCGPSPTRSAPGTATGWRMREAFTALTRAAHALFCE